MDYISYYRKSIPIFKEVTPEKNGWNKKGGNFLISREGQLCLVVKFAQSRENVSILDRNFPAPRLLLTWQATILFNVSGYKKICGLKAT